jgi:hypothetical protein
MNIEKKFPQNVSNGNNSLLKLFFNRYTNKLTYKDNNGILINLLTNTDNVATKESVNETISYSKAAFYGFTSTSSSINESLTLPNNSILSYTGPLILATGVVLTVPVGTTLTIV